MEAIDQESAGCRRLFRRLEHHRIAGEQRGNDMAVGQMRGEIIGAKHREHAVRLVPERHARPRLTIEATLRGALRIGLDRDVDLGDHRIDFGARFPQRLAGFARDCIGEGVAAGTDDIGEAAERLCPIGERLRSPASPALPRAADFGIDVADRAAPQHRAGGGFGRDDFVNAHVNPSSLARSCPKRRGFSTPRAVLAGKRAAHVAYGRDLRLEA